MAHNILENEELILPQNKETKMWLYHHAGIQFHRASL